MPDVRTTHAVHAAKPNQDNSCCHKTDLNSAAKVHQGCPSSNPTTAAVHARHSNPTIKDLQSQLVSIQSLPIREEDGLALACFQLRVIACLQTIVKEFQDSVQQSVVVRQLRLGERTSGLLATCCF